MIKRRVKVDEYIASFRRRNEKIYDVTLAEFADSNLPHGKGRIRKSRNVLSEVRRIITSEDIEDRDEREDNGSRKLISIGNLKDEGMSITGVLEENNNIVYSDYPLKIWLLVSEYIRPEDVMSFSLICKASLSVIKTPLFWIRLYKRYYKKVDLPKCLSRQCLQVKNGLKANVIKALFYFYPPYNNIVNDNSKQQKYESLIGHLCIRSWVQCIEGKEAEEGQKWVYNFKLCNKNINEVVSCCKKQHLLHCSNNMHCNADENCRLLRFVCKEYVSLPSVMGMKLRSLKVNVRSTSMRFSSAPLSIMGSRTELGTITINLEPTVKPSVLPWWHPCYTDHTVCPVCRPPSLISL